MNDEYLGIMEFFTSDISDIYISCGKELRYIESDDGGGMWTCLEEKEND